MAILLLTMMTECCCVMQNNVSSRFREWTRNLTSDIYSGGVNVNSHLLVLDFPLGNIKCMSDISEISVRHL